MLLLEKHARKRARRNMFLLFIGKNQLFPNCLSIQSNADFLCAGRNSCPVPQSKLFFHLLLLAFFYFSFLF